VRLYLSVLLPVLFKDELSLEPLVLVLSPPPVLASLSLVLRHPGGLTFLYGKIPYGKIKRNNNKNETESLGCFGQGKNVTNLFGCGKLKTSWLNFRLLTTSENKK
jgi:hypothetical protein